MNNERCHQIEILHARTHTCVYIYTLHVHKNPHLRGSGGETNEIKWKWWWRWWEEGLYLLIDDVTWRECLRGLPRWFRDWGDHFSICSAAPAPCKNPHVGRQFHKVHSGTIMHSVKCSLNLIIPLLCALKTMDNYLAVCRLRNNKRQTCLSSEMHQSAAPSDCQ